MCVSVDLFEPIAQTSAAIERAVEDHLHPGVDGDTEEVAVGGADDQVGVAIAVEVAGGQGAAEVLVVLEVARDTLDPGEEGAGPRADGSIRRRQLGLIPGAA